MRYSIGQGDEYHLRKASFTAFYFSRSMSYRLRQMRLRTTPRFYRFYMQSSRRDWSNLSLFSMKWLMRFMGQCCPMRCSNLSLVFLKASFSSFFRLCSQQLKPSTISLYFISIFIRKLLRMLNRPTSSSMNVYDLLPAPNTWKCLVMSLGSVILRALASSNIRISLILLPKPSTFLRCPPTMLLWTYMLKKSSIVRMSWLTILVIFSLSSSSPKEQRLGCGRIICGLGLSTGRRDYRKVRFWRSRLILLSMRAIFRQEALLYCELRSLMSSLNLLLRQDAPLTGLFTSIEECGILLGSNRGGSLQLSVAPVLKKPQSKEAQCWREESAMIFLLLSDLAAWRTGYSTSRLCLWVRASVREKEDFVRGLLSSREWCFLVGSEEERLVQSARGLLLNFMESSFFRRCCRRRAGEEVGPTRGGETGGPYMGLACRMRMIIILLGAKQRGRGVFCPAKQHSMDADILSLGPKMASSSNGKNRSNHSHLVLKLTKNESCFDNS